jgi:hypothetical protein
MRGTIQRLNRKTIERKQQRLIINPKEDIKTMIIET